MLVTTQFYPGPPGSLLHDARISAGKSVLETAEALNLLNSYVEAIEQNDYSQFNSPLFARGYIKSYARYIGLDEAPLLNDCDRICRREDQTSQQRHVRVGGKVRAPGHAGLILALLAGVGFWTLACWVYDGGESRMPAVVVLEQQLPSLPMLKLEPSLGEILLPSDLLKVKAEKLPVLPGVPGELKFMISEDVWLEVRDAHNNVSLSGVQQKGKTLHFTAPGAVTVNTAYWPVVAMYYNGGLVGLKELVNSNIVRVQVGEL
jgi:cytoskeleton protein RodZ